MPRQMLKQFEDCSQKLAHLLKDGRLFVKGLNRQEIAHSLKINEKTVSTYRARLFSKLQARNVVELVRYAVAEGLVD